MLKIGILFGGNSYEHEISIVSAISLKNELEFDLLFIFIDENRDLFLIDSEHLKASLFADKGYKKYPLLFFTNKGFNQKSLFKDKFIDCENIIKNGYN